MFDRLAAARPATTTPSTSRGHAGVVAGVHAEAVAVPGTGDGTLRDAIGVVRSAVDRGGADWGSDPARAATPLDEHALRARIQMFDQLAGLAAAGLAQTVRALADLGTIDRDGASSTADWIKSTTNRSGRAAARVARLATDLADLPATRDALATGRISDESADAIVQAARDGRLGAPGEVDTALVDVASTTTPEQLRAHIRERQQAVDATALLRDEQRQRARRSFRLWRRNVGMWGVTGGLPDELGQTFSTALDAFDRPDPEGTPDAQKRRPDQRLADALGAMLDAVLGGGTVPAKAGITRPHLSVIVQADTVATDLTRPDAVDPDSPSAAPAPDDPRWADLPAGELPWGGVLSPQAVRRICCDAAVSRIVMAGASQVLDVGRATRQWSGPQRRAVTARDRACRGPRCSSPIAWTAVHHLQWWRNDGPTSVDNGLALCHHCHGLVHDRGWTVELDLQTAHATWTSPTGLRVVTTPRPRGTDPPARSPATSPPADEQSAREPGTGPPADPPPAHRRGADSPARSPGADPPARELAGGPPGVTSMTGIAAGRAGDGGPSP